MTKNTVSTILNTATKLPSHLPELSKKNKKKSSSSKRSYKSLSRWALLNNSLLGSKRFRTRLWKSTTSFCGFASRLIKAGTTWKMRWSSCSHKLSKQSWTTNLMRHKKLSPSWSRISALPTMNLKKCGPKATMRCFASSGTSWKSCLSPSTKFLSVYQSSEWVVRRTRSSALKTSRSGLISSDFLSVWQRSSRTQFRSKFSARPSLNGQLITTSLVSN